MLSSFYHVVSALNLRAGLTLNLALHKNSFWVKNQVWILSLHETTVGCPRCKITPNSILFHRYRVQPSLSKPWKITKWLDLWFLIYIYFWIFLVRHVFGPALDLRMWASRLLSCCMLLFFMVTSQTVNTGKFNWLHTLQEVFACVSCIIAWHADTNCKVASYNAKLSLRSHRKLCRRNLWTQVYSTVRPTLHSLHTNPPFRLRFPKTFFKPECENVGFAFYCGRKTWVFRVNPGFPLVQCGWRGLNFC